MTTAAAAAPAAVSQCNPPAFPTGAGFEVNCKVTIENTGGIRWLHPLECHHRLVLSGSRRPPPFGCTTTVQIDPDQLVTNVDQCNGIVNGAGSNVTCDVTVINNVPVGTTTSDVRPRAVLLQWVPRRSARRFPAREMPPSISATVLVTEGAPRCA